MSRCRVCTGQVEEFLDLGRQPLSDAFRRPTDDAEEFFYALAVGQCLDCRMVQLMSEVPRERMFHADYPYHSSGSAGMREHFQRTARWLLETELSGPSAFVVELGCNDGVMLRSISDAGVRHLGVEPSEGVAEVARRNGVRVLHAFFEASTGVAVAAEHGPADVVYAANTFCHIPYVESVFEGLAALLRPDGVFVFEDPYWGDVVAQTTFDQIYDEHFYLFSVQSVQAMAARFGFELVDVARLPVHGGEVRYTLARQGARVPSPAVAALSSEEAVRGLHDRATLQAFAGAVRGTRDELTSLLRRLRREGKTVVGYGATAKSATVTNYCRLGPDTIAFICDSTPAKQGRLTPGSHIPVRPPDSFAAPYPDYVLLFAWNHAAEIMAKERAFGDAGGRWITYASGVRVLEAT